MADKLDNSAPFDDAQGTRIARQPTGAGAEAAEGIHGKPEERGARRDPSDRTSLEDRENPREAERSGSEPLESNSQDHQSGYGGRGGSPRESNDGTSDE